LSEREETFTGELALRGVVDGDLAVFYEHSPPAIPPTARLSTRIGREFVLIPTYGFGRSSCKDRSQVTLPYTVPRPSARSRIGVIAARRHGTAALCPHREG
jgi:hypothetical protein